jgi:hypothetical protein
VPQPPGTVEQDPVVNAAQGQFSELSQRIRGTLVAQLSRDDPAAECVPYLGVDQMRGPERSTGIGCRQLLFRPGGVLAADENSDDD